MRRKKTVPRISNQILSFNLFDMSKA